jgi:hypothetical protein
MCCLAQGPIIHQITAIQSIQTLCATIQLQRMFVDQVLYSSTRERERGYSVLSEYQYNSEPKSIINRKFHTGK